MIIHPQLMDILLKSMAGRLAPLDCAFPTFPSSSWLSHRDSSSWAVALTCETHLRWGRRNRYIKEWWTGACMAVSSQPGHLRPATLAEALGRGALVDVRGTCFIAKAICGALNMLDLDL